MSIDTVSAQIQKKLNNGCHRVAAQKKLRSCFSYRHLKRKPKSKKFEEEIASWLTTFYQSTWRTIFFNTRVKTRRYISY